MVKNEIERGILTSCGRREFVHTYIEMLAGTISRCIYLYDGSWEMKKRKNKKQKRSIYRAFRQL